MSRIEDLEGRLAKDPSSKIFGQLAEEYRKVGRLEDAITTCRDGLENHPNYFSARVALGRALLESNVLEEAGQELETVLAQVPDNILANKFLGETYEQLGRLDDAVAKYRIAQMLAPEDADLAERVQKLEAQLDGVPAGADSGSPEAAPPPPPLPVMEDPSAIEFPETPETEVEPTLLEEPPSSEREQLLEPTLTEGPIPQSVGPEREQVFEFEETPQEEPKPPSKLVGRQVSEISGSAPVSDEARAIQEEIEQSFPTGVMKRQMREIMDSTESPVSRETVIEETPLETSERGTTQPMSVDSEPSVEPVASTPSSPEMPAVPESPGMSTATMAELYASQGHLEQALSVYREILTKEPNDNKVRQRVEELTMLVHAQTEAGPSIPSKGKMEPRSDGQALTETVRILEGWLAAIRKS